MLLLSFELLDQSCRTRFTKQTIIESFNQFSSVTDLICYFVFYIDLNEISSKAKRIIELAASHGYLS